MGRDLASARRVIAELSDRTEPIAATEQIARHVGRILRSVSASARMAFAADRDRARARGRCNVRTTMGIVAVREAEICFNAQPALVDGAGPLKVFPGAYTRGVPGAPYSRRKRTRHAD